MPYFSPLLLLNAQFKSICKVRLRCYDVLWYRHLAQSAPDCPVLLLLATYAIAISVGQNAIVWVIGMNGSAPRRAKVATSQLPVNMAKFFQSCFAGLLVGSPKLIASLF
jgi:hypothetical protein